MEKKWKKRMIVNAEENSKRAPSPSTANYFENKQDKVSENVGRSKFRNKKVGNNSFGKLSTKEKNILLARLWRSDSESSESSIDSETWKNLADSFASNFTSSEEEDETEIPAASQKKKKLFMKKPRKPSKTPSFSKIQNISEASSNTINEKCPAPKNNRNSSECNINIRPTEPSSSSSTPQYIQFTVTHEYAALPYTETLQRALNVAVPNGVNDIIDSSIIEHITSNVHSSIRTLQQNFDEFRSDVLSFLKKNESCIPQGRKSSTTSNNINSEVFRKILDDELPSKSVAEFEKLNRLLAESEINRSELINRYSIVISGESCLKNCISKLMSYTLSHVVQSAYSGSGKKFRGTKKLNYSKTETYKCLKDVLEKKFGVEYPELKKLKARVGQWLANYVSRSK
ncbi:uncharacterized LOC118063786 [Chelonus insularis]|uniref:uncharacterized LOC118063786 n=1 Tax=Chelonus insularis TaxID=460826 RepID=UPI00158B727B|nr:uncharacterized LOC118063786 [Chelonus insularis]KAG8148359.1 CinsV16.8_orph2 protein [Chelonus insularis]